MSRSVRRGPPEAPRSEINVTPLVDVCLVLLIIFMVVTPMLDHHLPETPEPATLPKQEDRIQLEMREDLSVWLEKSSLTAPALFVRLRDLRTNSHPSKQVVLVADSRLSYRDVRGVMELVRNAGFSGLCLAATKETKGTRLAAIR
jgi:biopolymer transport protein TolR